MEKEKLILIGGGGHCKSCIDVIESTNKYDIVGIIDMPDKVGDKILGYPVIGSDDSVYDFIDKTDSFLITIGQLGLPKRRKEIFSELKSKGAKFATVVSSLAYVSKYSVIKEGTIIMHQVIVNADVEIGENCIINSKSLIEHDSKVGDHCHISTASVINGGVEVGSSCFFGSSTVSRESITIANETVVGAGSFVRKSIVKSGVYAGNPAKKYR